MCDLVMIHLMVMNKIKLIWLIYNQMENAPINLKAKYFN